MENTIIRLPQVIEKIQVPKSTLYKWMKKGLFPKPVVLGIRSVGWRSSDVTAWLITRPSR